MLKIMERKKIWLGLSLLMLIPGFISLGLWQLKLGIDFKGGSLSQYTLNEPDKQEQGSAILLQTFKDEGINEPSIQTDTTHPDSVQYFVKSESISSEKHQNIVRRLSEASPKLTEASFESIDAQVGSEVARRAVWAIVIASAAIIIYIALSFRGVPKPTSSWQFGVLAVVALLHDVAFIIGFYSLAGHYAGWEVNAEFVTAALTVMGFSVHDTIVVFDRIRENLRKHPGESFRTVTNISVSQTIARSLNTSITVALVLLAVALLGGANIRPFAVTLLVGVVIGTYSSIFVATALLDWWQSIRPTLRFTGRKLAFPRRRIAKLKRA